MTGTIFEGTHLRLQYWFLALDRFRQGKSVLWVSKELEIGRHTAEKMYQSLRKNIWTNRLMDELEGITEADEIYISCGDKGNK